MVLGTLTVLSLWAFVLDPQSAIWNQRLIPFLVHLDPPRGGLARGIFRLALGESYSRTFSTRARYTKRAATSATRKRVKKATRSPIQRRERCKHNAAA